VFGLACHLDTIAADVHGWADIGQPFKFSTACDGIVMVSLQPIYRIFSRLADTQRYYMYSSQCPSKVTSELGAHFAFNILHTIPQQK
jgi:hypothetical protein